MSYSAKKFIISLLAAIAWLIIFFVILYIGGAALDWSWRLFDSEEPGIITLIIRGLISSAISAVLSLAAFEALLKNYINRITAITFAIGITAWGAALAFLVPTASLKEAILAGYLPIILMVAPAYFVSYMVYSDQ